MTSPEPTPTKQPSTAADAALGDAITVEHATMYGYGFVSAHSTPELNELVSQSLAEHRARREAAIEMLTARSLIAPVPAVGYQLPIQVKNPTDAANLAVQMESDAAVAWRAVLERAETDGDREFAVAALTQCAVRAARWRQVVGTWPSTDAFPGGTE